MSSDGTPNDLKRTHYMQENGNSDASSASKNSETSNKGEVRKSIRSKKPKQIFTPDEILKRKKKLKKNTAPDRAFDTLPDGKPFCCDLCKSPYIINQSCKRALKDKRSRHVPDPKRKVDPWTGKILLLCNSCATTFDGVLRPKKTGQPVVSAEEKALYVEKVKLEAKALAEKHQIPEAERFYCSLFARKKCRCIQKYFSDVDDEETTKKRMREFIDLYNEAKTLSQQKSYISIPVPNASGKRTKKIKNLIPIGLGNGHKRSRGFTVFVLEKRLYLKNEVGLCERGTQRVLLYSNNFLHKKLKTEQRECRVKPLKGKAKLGLLETFDDMPKKRCCVDNCVMMALTHRKLLQQWRERASSSQTDARRVIAEMLTPSAGARCNCYNFITRVTGSSRSTIVQVNHQMLKTGGEREPPHHGLKKFWAGCKKEDRKKSSSNEQEQSKSRTETVTSQQEVTSSSPSISLVPNPVNMDITQQHQLLQLQQQMFDQQLQLQQHHSLQQQLLQHSMLQQIGGPDNTTQNLNMIQKMIEQLNVQIHQTQTQLQQSLQHLHNMTYSVQQNLLQGQIPSGPQLTVQQLASGPQLAIQQLPTGSQLAFPQTVACSQIGLQQTGSTLPQVATGMQIALPQANTSSQLLLPQNVTGSQLALPQGSMGQQIALPQVSMGQQITLPQVSMGQQIALPQVSMGQQIVLPQVSMGQQIALPQSSIGQQIVLPQAATGSQLALPQDNLGQQIVLPQGNLGQQIALPHSSSDSQLTLPQGNIIQQIAMPQGNISSQFSLPQVAATSSQLTTGSKIQVTQLNNSQLTNMPPVASVSMPQGMISASMPQVTSISVSMPPVASASMPQAISASMPQVISASMPQVINGSNLPIQQLMGSRITIQDSGHGPQITFSTSQDNTVSSKELSQSSSDQNEIKNTSQSQLSEITSTSQSQLSGVLSCPVTVSGNSKENLHSGAGDLQIISAGQQSNNVGQTDRPVTVPWNQTTLQPQQSNISKLQDPQQHQQQILAAAGSEILENVSKTFHNQSQQTNTFSGIKNQQIPSMSNISGNQNQNIGQTVTLVVQSNDKQMPSSGDSVQISSQLFSGIQGARTNSSSTHTVSVVGVNQRPIPSLSSPAPSQQTVNPSLMSTQRPVNPSLMSTQQPVNPSSISSQQPVNQSFLIHAPQQPINQSLISSHQSIQQPVNHSLSSHATSQQLAYQSLPSHATFQQPVNQSLPSHATFQQPVNQSLPSHGPSQQLVNHSLPSLVTSQQPVNPSLMSSQQPANQSLYSHPTSQQPVNQSLPSHGSSQQLVNQSLPSHGLSQQLVHHSLPSHASSQHAHSQLYSANIRQQIFGQISLSKEGTLDKHLPNQNTPVSTVPNQNTHSANLSNQTVAILPRQQMNQSAFTPTAHARTFQPIEQTRCRVGEQKGKVQGQPIVNLYSMTGGQGHTHTTDSFQRNSEAQNHSVNLNQTRQYLPQNSAVPLNKVASLQLLNQLQKGSVVLHGQVNIERHDGSEQLSNSDKLVVPVRLIEKSSNSSIQDNPQIESQVQRINPSFVETVTSQNVTLAYCHPQLSNLLSTSIGNSHNHHGFHDPQSVSNNPGLFDLQSAPINHGSNDPKSASSNPGLHDPQSTSINPESASTNPKLDEQQSTSTNQQKATDDARAGQMDKSNIYQVVTGLNNMESSSKVNPVSHILNVKTQNGGTVSFTQCSQPHTHPSSVPISVVADKQNLSNTLIDNEINLAVSNRNNTQQNYPLQKFVNCSPSVSTGDQVYQQPVITSQSQIITQQPILLNSSGDGIVREIPQQHAVMQPSIIVAPSGDIVNQQPNVQPGQNQMVAPSQIVLTPTGDTVSGQRRLLQLNIQLQTNSPQEVANILQLLQNSDLSQLPIPASQTTVNFSQAPVVQSGNQRVPPPMIGPFMSNLGGDAKSVSKAIPTMSSNSVAKVSMATINKSAVQNMSNVSAMKTQTNDQTVHPMTKNISITPSTPLTNTSVAVFQSMSKYVSKEMFQHSEGSHLESVQPSKAPVYPMVVVDKGQVDVSKTEGCSTNLRSDQMDQRMNYSSKETQQQNKIGNIQGHAQRTVSVGHFQGSNQMRKSLGKAVTQQEYNQTLVPKTQGQGYTIHRQGRGQNECQGQISQQGQGYVVHKQGLVDNVQGQGKTTQGQGYSVPKQGLLDNVQGQGKTTQGQDHSVHRDQADSIQRQISNIQSNKEGDLMQNSNIVQGIIQGQHIQNSLPVNCTLVLTHKGS